ncbi:MAG: RluA family pseudouridine synthase [Bacteroidota bacterium]
MQTPKRKQKESPAIKKENKTSLTVDKPNELMKFLIESLPNKKRFVIKSILTHKQVKVNKKAISQYNHLLKPNDEVVINWDITPEEPKYRDLRIVFEDEHIIVIEKYPGLLTIATDKKDEKTAYSILSGHVKKTDPANKIFIIHRIDRETSGLLMFAKSLEIQHLMQEHWQDTVLERKYVAVVEGAVKQESGTIKSWLYESKALIMYSTQDSEDGQLAITHYKLIRKNKYYSLLELELETGRKNQIRVHMKDIGHSIIGDKKYGGSQSPIGRVGLHARKLAFTHPITKENMSFETNIPYKFLSLFQK